MRLPSPLIPIVGLALTGALVAACSESPTEPGTAAEAPEAAAGVTVPPPPPFRGPTMHYALVNADGTLVGGTATSAQHYGLGTYRVTFPESVDGCAAAANAAAFPGFDALSAQLIVTLSIGYIAPDLVTVALLKQGTVVFEDSSFSLLLMCPAQ